MRLLAIDLGLKRTGLAIGDDQTGIVTPLDVVEVNDDRQRLTAIDRAIETHGADALVVGLPLNMDGSEGPAAERARAFADELRRHFEMDVHLFDERLSTCEADRQMAGSGLTHGKKKARRDALAAAVILSGYLASR